LRARKETQFDCPISGPVAWEAKDVFNPAAVVHEGKVYLMYRAEDLIGCHAGVSRIGLAVSEDGLHFERLTRPVLFPSRDPWFHIEWEGGCEDPRLARRDDGLRVCYYTAFDGSVARLCVASSKDLLNWQKHGPAFARGAYANAWSKSGAALVEARHGHLIAARVRGRYWMYWGESCIFCATSDDLISWTPVEHTEAVFREVKHLGGADYASRALATTTTLRAIAHTRLGRFDSLLCEPGPCAVLTNHGAVLIYNGSNAPGRDGDPSLPERGYSVGQLLLDAEDPTAVIGRLSQPCLRPELDWELRGQFGGGTTFSEGLVLHRGKWFLYYGAADSAVGVATAVA
jgi:predicted GH43/DUF377 family glycosyl hydrolase